MGRGIGKVQKKRFFSMRLTPLYTLTPRLVVSGNILIGIPITAHRPRAALPATFFDGLPL